MAARDVAGAIGHPGLTAQPRSTESTESTKGSSGLGPFTWPLDVSGTVDSAGAGDAYNEDGYGGVLDAAAVDGADTTERSGSDNKEDVVKEESDNNGDVTERGRDYMALAAKDVSFALIPRGSSPLDEKRGGKGGKEQWNKEGAAEGGVGGAEEGSVKEAKGGSVKRERVEKMKGAEGWRVEGAAAGRVENASNIVSVNVNWKVGVAPGSAACVGFQGADKTSVCPAIAIHRSYGVQVGAVRIDLASSSLTSLATIFPPSGTVYGGVDVVWSMNGTVYGGVRSMNGTVYGRVDVVRSMNVRVDSLKITAPSLPSVASPAHIRVALSGIGPSLLKSNVLITNNEVYNARIGIVLHRGAVGVAVASNYVHGFTGAGIMCGAGPRFVGDCMLVNVSNNVVQAPWGAMPGAGKAIGIVFSTHWINPGLPLSAADLHPNRCERRHGMQPRLRA
ncbi:unnamed protein product [Closterium sp. Naga37s-1]|nr:unnamed protein product [Closterium sp. Naga37s-1]